MTYFYSICIFVIIISWFITIKLVFHYKSYIKAHEDDIVISNGNYERIQQVLMSNKRVYEVDREAIFNNIEQLCKKANLVMTITSGDAIIVGNIGIDNLSSSEIKKIAKIVNWDEELGKIDDDGKIK